MTAQPHWSSLDDDTGDLLDMIQADWRPFAEDDRNTVARAIRDDGLDHAGEVNPNRVREALASLPVAAQPKPQRVGPVYRALRLMGDLEVAGYDTSDDHRGRNSGKPCLTYRWVGGAQ